PFQLLAQDREAQIIHPRAAPAFGDRRSKESLVGHLREDLAVNLALLVPLANVRQDLGLGERASRALDETILVAALEVDHRRMLAGPFPLRRTRCNDDRHGPAPMYGAVSDPDGGAEPSRG